MASVTQTPLKRKQILNSFITNEPYETILETIVDLGKRHQSAYVCLANAHMLIEAYKDEAFNAIVNESDIAAPDGRPLSLGMNLLYGTRQEQVAGMDLMLGILKRAEESGLSVFF